MNPAEERTLALAVINRAARDRNLKDQRAEADRWMRFNLPTRGSFRWWAERADQDPRAVRRAVLR